MARPLVVVGGRLLRARSSSHQKAAFAIAYDAFGRGDATAALDVFAEDAVYVIGGASQISGEYHGKGEIQALWRRIGEAGAALTVEGFFSDGERVIVLVRERVGEVTWHAASVFTFRNGRAVRFESIEDSAALERAFGRRREDRHSA